MMGRGSDHYEVRRHQLWGSARQIERYLRLARARLGCCTLTDVNELQAVQYARPPEIYRNAERRSDKLAALGAINDICGVSESRIVRLWQVMPFGPVYSFRTLDVQGPHWGLCCLADCGEPSPRHSRPNCCRCSRQVSGVPHCWHRPMECVVTVVSFHV